VIGAICRRLLVVFLLFPCFGLDAQLKILITGLPYSTPEGDTLFFAGSINGWNPHDPDFMFRKNPLTGLFELNIPQPAASGKFKVTRGSWSSVECRSDGSNIGDRVYMGESRITEINIEAWHDISGLRRRSTAGPGVHIFADSFYMPELSRYRKIRVYIPPDYTRSKKKYPVIYMHDGQNAFDEATSYAGEWRVDESLDSLFSNGDKGCIVVAIDNGGDKRLEEYSPWVHSKYGGGVGTAYASFIVNTLKPFVDKHFRTRRDRKNTAIIGSSMGGLISMYTAMTYPEVFGKVGAFSTSYWFSDQIFLLPFGESHKKQMRYFLIAGGKEGDTQTADMDKMCSLLKQTGIRPLNLKCAIFADDGHNEAFWAREFPSAYKWLFEK